MGIDGSAIDTSAALVYHFTDEAHLPAIVEHGLLSDSAVGSLSTRQAGDPDIKSRRRAMIVPVGKGGSVADYVPFYFAPRSPMMYVISRGRVASYGMDLSRLMYLVTSIEQLNSFGLAIVVSRRNAAMANADFTDDLSRIGQHIDWPLMAERQWADTLEDGDRKARRMAECLVHGRVPIEAILSLAVFDQAAEQRVTGLLATLGIGVPVHVERDWYY